MPASINVSQNSIVLAAKNSISSDCPSYVIELNANDVLLGRGATSDKNEGNIRFRDFIRQRKSEYVSARCHQIKHAISNEIVDTIRMKGGRFLRRLDNPIEAEMLIVPKGVKAYAIADKDVVLLKVKQALRDNQFRKETPNNCVENPKEKLKQSNDGPQELSSSSAAKKTTTEVDANLLMSETFNSCLDPQSQIVSNTYLLPDLQIGTIPTAAERDYQVRELLRRPAFGSTSLSNPSMPHSTIQQEPHLNIPPSLIPDYAILRQELLLRILQSETAALTFPRLAESQLATGDVDQMILRSLGTPQESQESLVRMLLARNDEQAQLHQLILRNSLESNLIPFDASRNYLSPLDPHHLNVIQRSHLLGDSSLNISPVYQSAATVQTQIANGGYPGFQNLGIISSEDDSYNLANSVKTRKSESNFNSPPEREDQKTSSRKRNLKRKPPS